MRLPETRIDRGQVNVIAGNVTRMPPLGGRPCFGNPIAWAVHGRIETIPTRLGPRPTRCGRCKARPGCERVSEARLAITTEILEAGAALRAAGGRRSLRSQTPETVRRALGQLIQLLAAHGPFKSTNDQFAREWVSRQRDWIRKSAIERKRKERVNAAVQALRHRQIPDVLAEQMEIERHYRAVRYRQYRASGEAPSTIAVDPKHENDRFTADVWLAREQLAIMEKPTTPYGIATQMIERERSYDLSHPVLQDRVRKALKRISVLERARMPSTVDPVWPPFNAKSVLSELLADPPLRNASLGW